MTRLQYLTIFLTWLTIPEALTSEPTIYTINTKKWSHVLDDHFISITVNPTDILQGRAFGLGMNSTMEILKGLAPAYIRLGSADTNKYAFRKSHFGNDVVKSEDEFIITESHWMILNEAAKSAGLDIIVCLNAGHRNGATNKWDTRNSLELISFSESQGYNLTFQLGYEVQKAEHLSGVQFGKDLNRLRTILNAFPRYQNSKLIGPDVKILHRKEDVDFVNDVLIEAGPTLDAITWHPRWPQPSKMKVSDISEFGYEFPADYLDWDRIQLNKILQRSIFKNPVWIGEPKTECTGTFAEGLLWARRLVLAAKQGIEVVMKQPSLMDISHPKPEYWIALLHKRLLGKSVLETRSMLNQTDMAVITHCTNPVYWSDKPDKPQDGAVTVYAVNMGGNEQRLQIKGTATGRPQHLFQFILTSGNDPDSVFSQMTYLNGEPLMMTDEGMLPELKPRIKKIERSVNVKLPPYSIGFWVVPEAKVRICQIQPVTIPVINLDTLSPANVIKNTQKGLQSIRNINQFIVDKLTNPMNDVEEESSSVEDEDMNSIDSDERGTIKEKRHSKRHRRQVNMGDIAYELKKSMDDIRGVLESNNGNKFRENLSPEHHAHLRAAQEKIDSLTSELSTAVRMSNQDEEFGKFLDQAGLKADFGKIMMRERGIPVDDGQRRYEEEKDWEEPLSENYFENPKRMRRELQDEESSDESLESSIHKKISPKALEDRYKALFSNQIEKGKRKIEEIKNKMMKEGEHVKAIILPDKIPLGISTDIQEEILIKEIEVLEKTEETMADLMRNHKKRQEAIEEMIREEINEIKEDRLMALEEVRLQKQEAEGKSPKKKTEEMDIRKNMKKNIDMLEEMIKTLDQKKTNKRETKGEKSSKKKEEEEEEEEEEENNTEEKKEKVNVIRKFLLRKGEKAKEKVDLRTRLREQYNRIVKKSKKESSAEKENDVVEKTENEEQDKSVSEEKEESVETTPKPVEHVPLKKNDEHRRTDVLKQISSIVEKMGKKNKNDDISGEFEFDPKTHSGVKRNPRKADKDEQTDPPKKSVKLRNRSKDEDEDLKKEENEARRKPIFHPKFGRRESVEFEDSSENNENETTETTTVEPGVEVTDAPVDEVTEVSSTIATTAAPEVEKSERKKREVEDDINFSSEERIKQFKEMKQRKFANKSKNDIPLDADNFIKMAGSTVKVMFDEVIPEAYDTTKEKIKTLGNFVNGENHDDESPNHQHVQVIHRRKRNTDEESPIIPKEDRELIKEILEQMPEVEQVPEIIEEEQRPFLETSPEGGSDDSMRLMGLDKTDTQTNNEIEQETPPEAVESQPEIIANPIENQQDVPADPIENQQQITAEPIESQPEIPSELNQIVETTTGSPDETQIEESPEEEEDYYHMTKTGRRIPIRRKKPEELLKNLRENKISKYHKVNPEEESPWVRTTKEFIQQALSALQRQRELSEIVTRETLNDLVKREIARKVIGKREVPYEYSKNIVKRQLYPVYQIPEEPNRKREVPFQPPPAPTNLADLHPGVYVVPTKDTTNIRSEQVAPPPNASAPKTGMPNVVTLNIYYDRKGQPVVGNEPPVAGNHEPHPDYSSYYPNYPSYPAQPVQPAQPPATTYHAPQNYAPPPQSYPVQYQPPAQEHYPQRTHQPVYEQVYVQPAETYPKSVSKWGEYKVLNAPETNLLATDPNWNIQYESKKKSSDRQDKRRSIANAKFDPNMLEPALPFWKYFSETYKTGNAEKSSEETTESNSMENLFEENRKRKESKKPEKVPELEPKPEDEVPVRDERSISHSPKNKIPEHKLVKRSSPFYDEFFAYLPSDDSGLFDTINSGLMNDEIRLLRDLSQDGNIGVDDDYFLLNNMLYDEPIRRRRSVDDMLKTNMIEKSPMDNTGIQHEVLTKGKILKALTDEDSSLEVPKAHKTNIKKSDEKKKEAEEKKEETDSFQDFFTYAFQQLSSFMKTISDLF